MSKTDATLNLIKHLMTRHSAHFGS